MVLPALLLWETRGSSGGAHGKNLPPRPLWGGPFWEDGYFARTVGDQVTADVIRRYIQAHRDAPDDVQRDLF